jgi:hypothetical protein
VDPDTCQALDDYLVTWEEEGYLLGQERRLLFVWPNGSPLHPDTITDLFHKHCGAAGLPRIRLHDVRHSYATAALKAGVSPKVISERLGHSTVAFTLQTYTHVIPGMDELAADTGAKLILAEPVSVAVPDAVGSIGAEGCDLDIPAGQGHDDPESGEWAQRGSNPRPLVCKTRALPLSYTPSKPAQTSERERALRTQDRV